MMQSYRCSAPRALPLLFTALVFSLAFLAGCGGGGDLSGVDGAGVGNLTIRVVPRGATRALPDLTGITINIYGANLRAPLTRQLPGEGGTASFPGVPAGDKVILATAFGAASSRGTVSWEPYGIGVSYEMLRAGETKEVSLGLDLSSKNADDITSIVEQVRRGDDMFWRETFEDGPYFDVDYDQEPPSSIMPNLVTRGLRDENGVEWTFAPALVAIPGPAKVGTILQQTARATNHGGSATWQVDTRVEGFEMVAGLSLRPSFRSAGRQSQEGLAALKIRYDISVSSNGRQGPSQFTELVWYGAGIGSVMRMRLDPDGNVLSFQQLMGGTGTPPAQPDATDPRHLAPLQAGSLRLWRVSYNVPGSDVNVGVDIPLGVVGDDVENDTDEIRLRFNKTVNREEAENLDNYQVLINGAEVDLDTQNTAYAHLMSDRRTVVINPCDDTKWNQGDSYQVIVSNVSSEAGQPIANGTANTLTGIVAPDMFPPFLRAIVEASDQIIRAKASEPLMPPIDIHGLNIPSIFGETFALDREDETGKTIIARAPAGGAFVAPLSLSASSLTDRAGVVNRTSHSLAVASLEDTVPPALAPGSQGVRGEKNRIHVTFTEPINPEDATADHFEAEREPSGQPIDLSNATFSVSGEVVWIEGIDPGCSQIKMRVSDIRDLAGNTLAWEVGIGSVVSHVSHVEAGTECIVICLCPSFTDFTNPLFYRVYVNGQVLNLSRAEFFFENNASINGETFDVVKIARLNLQGGQRVRVEVRGLSNIPVDGHNNIGEATVDPDLLRIADAEVGTSGGVANSIVRIRFSGPVSGAVQAVNEGRVRLETPIGSFRSVFSASYDGQTNTLQASVSGSLQVGEPFRARVVGIPGDPEGVIKFDVFDGIVTHDLRIDTNSQRTRAATDGVDVGFTGPVDATEAENVSHYAIENLTTGQAVDLSGATLSYDANSRVVRIQVALTAFNQIRVSVSGLPGDPGDPLAAGSEVNDSRDLFVSNGTLP